jgi:hypothetical protein
MLLRFLSLTGVLMGVPGSGQAQGSLSTLGFGYPVAGASTRVSGTAGAFGEIDALSPLNPAAVGGVLRTVVSVQAEPEFRTLRVGALRERTRSQRIPLVSVIFPARRGIAVGFSASSFLDRSYTLRTTGTVGIGGTEVNTNDILDVRGSIGQLRGAVGWQINQRFKVGLGGHLFTGDNLVARVRTFPDTLAFGGIEDTSQVTYFGTGVSIGGEAVIGKGLAATMSYRAGGGLDARVRDTVRANANVPSQLGGSLRYEGIPGSTFALAVEQISWSRMRGIGSSRNNIQDATNWRFGAETVGPRWRGMPMLLRAGFARNQLPFSTSTARVTETRWSTGMGVPIARDFGTIDLSVQRASRVLGGSNARESAWLLGIGLQVRPGG